MCTRHGATFKGQPIVPPPSTNEQTPLDKHQARREIVQIQQALRASIFSWAIAAGCTARLLDHGIEGISYPLHYLAKALDLSPTHVRWLRAGGRALRLVASIGAEYRKAVEIEPKSGRPILTERAIRPLTKLLDRPDDLKVAFRQACDAVPDGKRLTSAETATAVEAILDGGDSPKTGMPAETVARPAARQQEKRPDARENVEVVTDDRIACVYEFWQAVAVLVVQAQQLPGDTSELREALTRANKFAHTIYVEAQQRAGGLWEAATPEIQLVTCEPIVGTERQLGDARGNGVRPVIEELENVREPER